MDPASVRKSIETIYRSDGRRVFATLVRLLGDFDFAEEVLQDAFAETQAALTLREICGLTTEEIAAAFLSSPATIAQRIVRGKAKIRDANIPYQVPARADLPDRVDSVLSVIYLVFNEGYSASSGPSLTRAELSQEGIRLARRLLELLPDAEVRGLLALMLLHESRREARASAEGELILLEDQNRNLWNQELMREGTRLVEEALASPGFGTYSLQAAIAAVHAQALHAAATDWNQIVALYDVLWQATASPLVELNRAVREACMKESTLLCHELNAKGQCITASPLHAVATATSVRMRNGKRLVTDGPFAETTEQLGGYYIVDVPNLDEALDIASRLPGGRRGTVEVRPVQELPDLPQNMIFKGG